jgi:hypothetical protein
MAQQAQALSSPAQLTEDQLASQAKAVPQLSGQATYTVVASITNVRGKVQLGGFNTGAVGRYDFIGLYKDSFPSDPNSNLVTYQYVSNGLPHETGEIFGPGWLVAYVAFDYTLGRYVYQATAGPTK